MKKIILTVLAVMLPFVAGAQKTTFGQLQEKYAGREGYTIVEITQAMLELLRQNNKNEQVCQMIGAISGIKQITIIMADKAENEFTNDVKNVVAAKSEYKLLTSICENGQNVLFHYKDNPELSKTGDTSVISELIMIMYGSEDNLIMRIRGEFSIKQISSAVDKNSV